MQRLAAFALALSGAQLSASPSPALPCLAQQMLGPTVWSQVIRIENCAPRSRYPADFCALVFELDDVLWLYTPYDGTQSLSRYRGRVERDKAGLGDLLRAVDPH